MVAISALKSILTVANVIYQTAVTVGTYHIE